MGRHRGQEWQRVGEICPVDGFRGEEDELSPDVSREAEGQQQVNGGVLQE